MAIACSTSVRCGRLLEEALTDIQKLGFGKIDILTIDGWVHVNTTDLADCVETLKEQISIGTEAGVTFALELHVNSPF